MAVTVRPLTEADIPAYVEMAAEFHAACPVSDIMPFDPVGAQSFLASSLDNPTMGVWLSEIDDEIVGICAAVVYPMYFSPANTAAQELWWWLTPAARGSGAAQLMFKKIEEWAKASGAAALFMIALHDDNVERMAKLYGRAGLKPMERSYVKGL